MVGQKEWLWWEGTYQGKAGGGQSGGRYTGTACGGHLQGGKPFATACGAPGKEKCKGAAFAKATWLSLSKLQFIINVLQSAEWLDIAKPVLLNPSSAHGKNSRNTLSPHQPIQPGKELGSPGSP